MKVKIPFQYISGSLLALLFLVVGVKALAQSQEDSLFWAADPALEVLIDSFGRDYMIAEVNKNLASGIDFCQKQQLLDEDSIAVWVNAIRWGVILGDENSMQLLSDFIATASEGERGPFQYYFNYMAMWGLFSHQTKAISGQEKIALIIHRIQNPGGYYPEFYEDRLMESGPAALPQMIEYAREHIIPNMAELDKTMESEEDLQFTIDYLALIDLFKNMIKSNKDRHLFKNLLKEEAPDVRRFARDVLNFED